jgi:hypothetical protein
MPKSIQNPKKPPLAAAKSEEKLPPGPAALAAGRALAWPDGWHALCRAGLRLPALPRPAAVKANGRPDKEAGGGGAA